MSNINNLPAGFRLLKVKDAFGSLFGMHKTGTLANAESIAHNGFDLNRFGNTAKIFGVPKSLVENDPYGMFSTPSKNNEAKASQDFMYSGEGYVFFEVSPEALVLIHEMSGNDAKKAIKAHYGDKTSKGITQSLLSTGAHLVASNDLDDEMIVLRTNIINIKEAGIKNGPTFPVSDPYAKENEASFG